MNRHANKGRQSSMQQKHSEAAKNQSVTFEYLDGNVKVAAAQQSSAAALTRRNGNETISKTRLRSGRQFRSDHRPELSGAGTRARRRTLS
jgi:hypothetical protein